MMTKKCKGCQKTKELSDFSINQTYTDGRNARCKSCINERQRKSRAVADPAWQEENLMQCEKQRLRTRKVIDAAFKNQRRLIK